MIGIDLTFLRKEEISKGYLTEGVSIYCERVLIEFEKMNIQSQFILIVFKDQAKAVKSLFPNYETRIIDCALAQIIRTLANDYCFYNSIHLYMREFHYSKYVKDLDCIWFPFAIASTYVNVSIPSISTVHDLIIYQRDSNWKKDKFRKGVINSSSQIVAISNTVATEITQTFVTNNNICVIPNIVDHASSSTKPVNEVKERKYILDVNAYSERKNTITVLKAFNILKDEINSDLVLCGGYIEKEYYKRIKEYIDENALKDRVHVFLGLQEEERNFLYQNADLFIMPSLAEGFGRTPIEAALEMIPVICSDIPVLREVTLGLVSYYSPPCDESELAAAIRKILKSPISKHELEKIANLLKDHYSPQSCAQKYIALFRKYDTRLNL